MVGKLNWRPRDMRRLGVAMSLALSMTACAAIPFGGYKMSGFGRDMGRQSLDAYLETKSVVMAL